MAKLDIQALDAALLAAAAYGNGFSGNMPKDAYLRALKASGLSESQVSYISNKYSVIDSVEIAGTNTVLFKNNSSGKQFLAIDGTEFNSLNEGINDALADFSIGLDAPFSKNEIASGMAKAAINYYDSRSELEYGTVVTGHSLGGAVAAYTSYHGKIESVYTFNSPGNGGVLSSILGLAGYSSGNSKVHVYSHENDIVSTIGYPPNSEAIIPHTGVDGVLNAHSILSTIESMEALLYLASKLPKGYEYNPPVELFLPDPKKHSSKHQRFIDEL